MATVNLIVADFLARFLRRLQTLQRGRRYQIVLTLRDDGADWSISDLGKIEE